VFFFFDKKIFISEDLQGSLKKLLLLLLLLLLLFSLLRAPPTQEPDPVELETGEGKK
jgi:hypothetical protein